GTAKERDTKKDPKTSREPTVEDLKKLEKSLGASDDQQKRDGAGDSLKRLAEEAKDAKVREAAKELLEKLKHEAQAKGAGADQKMPLPQTEAKEGPMDEGTGKAGEPSTAKNEG